MTVLTVLVAADNWGSVARDKETHQELSMTIGNATWDIQQSKEEVGKNCWSISPFSDPTKTTIQDGDLMARLIIVDPYPFSNQKVAPVVSPGPKLPFFFVVFFFPPVGWAFGRPGEPSCAHWEPGVLGCLGWRAGRCLQWMGPRKIAFSCLISDLNMVDGRYNELYYSYMGL